MNRFAFLLLIAGPAACSYTTEQSMYESVAGPGDDGGGQGGGFRVTGSQPALKATDVPLGAAVILTFSDVPDPATTTFPAIQLRSGQSNNDFAARVDLLASTVTIQKATPFAPTVQYEVLVGTQVRSLAGAALASAATITFTTGTTPGGGPPPPTARTLAKDVQPLFDMSCSFFGCHDSKTASGGLTLQLGAARAALAGVHSSEVMAMARVQPGDPAQSYLIRKLINAPGIVDSPMPLGSMWSADQIRIVSDWIAGGALP